MHPEATSASNTSEAISHILKQGDAPIESVFLSAHGPFLGSSSLSLEDDFKNGNSKTTVDANNEIKWRTMAIDDDEWLLLRNRFSSDGWLSLGGCSTAEGEAGQQNINYLAIVLNTTVVGATGTQESGVAELWGSKYGIHGDAFICRANGSCLIEVGFFQLSFSSPIRFLPAFFASGISVIISTGITPITRFKNWVIN